jgi:hypothetical protein
MTIYRNTLFAVAFTTVLPLTFSIVNAQESAAPGPQPMVPHVDPGAFKAAADAYSDPPPALTDRKTFVAPKTSRGTTVPIPEATVIQFCSGKDGCIVRMGMHNWDDTGRVASRHFLFFYNKDAKTWRAELGDTAGTNANNVTEHVNQSWSCYFTDGAYSNWQNLGDTSLDFGLLSWNQYNADCYLTFVR